MQALMEALGKAQAEIKGIAMDGYNPYYSSRFTTLKLILETIKPILRKHELVLTLPITGEDGQVGIEQILFHVPTGESLTERIVIPVSGNNIAQESGKTITYLRRYAIASLFNIYSDEDLDANDPEQKVEEETDIQELIDTYWTPLAKLADEMKIEFEPLPPDVTEKGFEKQFLALKKKVEGAK
jgi:hypothetical protein